MRNLLLTVTPATRDEVVKHLVDGDLGAATSALQREHLRASTTQLTYTLRTIRERLEFGSVAPRSTDV